MAIIGLFCKEINNKELLFIKNKFFKSCPSANTPSARHARRMRRWRWATRRRKSFWTAREGVRALAATSRTSVATPRAKRRTKNSQKANWTANYNVNCNHTLSTHLFQCFTKAIGDVPRPSHSVNPVILFEKLKCKIIRLIPLQQFDFHKWLDCQAVFRIIIGYIGLGDCTFIMKP